MREPLFGQPDPGDTPRKPCPFHVGSRVTRDFGLMGVRHGVVETINDEWWCFGTAAYQVMTVRLDTGKPQLTGWLGWMPDPYGKLVENLVASKVTRVT